MGSLAYIRKYYKVPAKRGGTVSFLCNIWKGQTRFSTDKRRVCGTIIGSSGGKLKIRHDDFPGMIYIIHPQDDGLQYKEIIVYLVCDETSQLIRRKNDGFNDDH